MYFYFNISKKLQTGFGKLSCMSLWWLPVYKICTYIFSILIGCDLYLPKYWLLLELIKKLYKKVNLFITQKFTY